MELLTDPKGVGYAAMDKFQAAAALNTVGLTDEVEPSHATTSVQILTAIGVAVLAAMKDKDRQTLDSLILAAPTVDLWDADLWALITEILVDEPEALARVEALRTTSTSRAMVLDYGPAPEGFPERRRIQYCDVARARDES
ncbi:MAG TPA: hypothetical protein VM223_27025 [Planctomycetota bacterium]|nr:hypothetical protein [Planctomycetota bacterium]